MSLNSIRSKIRFLIGDTLSNVTDVFEYGSSKVFTLSEPNLGTITEVYRNDNSSGVVYTTSSNKVTISSVLTAGDTIQIDFTCYQNYSDTELTGFIQAALIYLSTMNYGDFQYDETDDEIYPSLESKEENLVALITSVLINPENKTIRLPDITLSAPNGMSVNDRIRQILASYKKDSTGNFDLLY